MPAKIWYNGSMHNMTSLKMVTFVNGQKKYLSKGVTFVNGQKKILWQTGNFSINSWTLSQLNYPNQNDLPVGLYCNDNRIIYSAGEYVARANISNISYPTNENCVKNGRVRTWLYPYYTASNESFGGDVKSYTSYTMHAVTGQNITVTVELTTVNKLNLNTNDLSVVSSDSLTDTRDNNYLSNGVYCYDSTYGWVVVKSFSGSIGGWFAPASAAKYSIYKNGSTLVTDIAVTGYTGATSPSYPLVAIQSGGFILLSTKYQATSGGTITYGLKRVNLSNGNMVDIESGLTNEITAILVDGNHIVYSYGNTVVRATAAGNNKQTFNTTNSPAVILGKIGSYYYVGSSRSVIGSNSKYLTVDILNVSDMTLRESRQTDIKATIINALPYISNNEYLCFGTYHSVGQAANSTTNISISYRTLPSGTLSDVQYRVVRIHGF